MMDERKNLEILHALVANTMELAIFPPMYLDSEVVTKTSVDEYGIKVEIIKPEEKYMNTAEQIKKPEITFREVSYREWCKRKWNMTPRELKSFMKLECDGRSRACYTIWVRNILDVGEGVTVEEFQDFNKQRTVLRMVKERVIILFKRDHHAGDFEIGVGARFS